MAEKDIYISKIHGAKIRDEELTQKLDERCEKIIEDTSSSFRAVDDEIEDLRTQVESNFDIPPVYSYNFVLNTKDNNTLSFLLYTPYPQFTFRALKNTGIIAVPIILSGVKPRLMMSLPGSVQVFKYDGDVDDEVKVTNFNDVSSVECNGKKYNLTGVLALQLNDDSIFVGEKRDSSLSLYGL